MNDFNKTKTAKTLALQGFQGCENMIISNALCSAVLRYNDVRQFGVGVLDFNWML